MVAEKAVGNNFEKIVAIIKFFVFLQRNSDGVLAQLVERLNGIQKVRSSILLCSTNKKGNSLKINGCLFAITCHYRINIMLPVIEGNVVEAINVVPHNKTQQAANKQLILLI